MKFKNKNGDVFSKIEVARLAFCETQKCAPCPVSKRNNTTHEWCRLFVLYHPEEAARLMGYEIIREQGIDFPAPEYDPEDVAFSTEDKPPESWTLREVKAYCAKRDCVDCKFYIDTWEDICCKLNRDTPSMWELRDPNATQWDFNAYDASEIYKTALKTFGPEAQTRMVFEEMAELQKALCKHARGEDNVDAIAEEIADVQIMLEQMILLHDCKAEVLEYRNAKLARLKWRMESGSQTD